MTCTPSHPGRHTTTKVQALALPKREPDEFCNARIRSGAYCQQKAGWCTPTPGFGRCKLHGGLSPRYRNKPDVKIYQSAGLATPRSLEERAAAYLVDTDLLDVSREIARLRAQSEAVQLKLDNEGQTDNLMALETLTRMADTIGKLISRQEELMRGRRYVVPVRKVEAWAKGIRAILERNVKDPILLADIGAEIALLVQRDEDYPTV